MTGSMTETPSPAAPAPAKGRTWVKVLLAVGVLAMFGMWGYALWFAPDGGAYQIRDAGWAPKARAICAAARTEREALADTEGGRITNPTPEQMAQRADLVDRATDILEQMLDDIVAIPVADENDTLRLSIFEENYRIIIADRRRYTERLRAGDNSEYNETVVAGGPVSNVVTDFTAGVKSNQIPECSPPLGDVTN